MISMQTDIATARPNTLINEKSLYFKMFRETILKHAVIAELSPTFRGFYNIFSKQEQRILYKESICFFLP